MKFPVFRIRDRSDIVPYYLFFFFFVFIDSSSTFTLFLIQADKVKLENNVSLLLCFLPLNLVRMQQGCADDGKSICECYTPTQQLSHVGWKLHSHSGSTHPVTWFQARSQPAGDLVELSSHL